MDAKFYQAQFVGLKANLHFLAENVEMEQLTRMRDELLEIARFMERRMAREKRVIANSPKLAVEYDDGNAVLTT